MRKIIALGFFSIIFIASLASAQQLPAPPIAVQSLLDFLKVIFVGDMSAVGADIIARVLIFLVLMIVLQIPAAAIVGGNRKIGTVLSMLVSVMAIRFFTPEMVKGLFLPYETLGVVISILLPFILFEFFMIGLGNNFPKPFRTVGYLMMAGIFTGLWWFRWTDIGDLAWIYLGASALAIIALWLDTSFRVMLASTRLGSAQKRQALLRSVKLEGDLGEAMDAYVSAEASGNKESADFAKKEVDRLTKAISHLKRF